MNEKKTDIVLSDYLLAKEISWLSFNERVLQEANDPNVPIVERLRYLGIFSNNLDEFFRVRVADVRRLAVFSTPAQQEPYRELLEQIQNRVIRAQRRFEGIYANVLRDLRKRHIYIVDEQQLDTKQTKYIREYFRTTVQPHLVPVLLDDANPIPELSEASFYLAIKIQANESVRYALLEIPTHRLDRFVPIPKSNNKRGLVFIVLENIIRKCLHDVFRGVFAIDSAEAYTIKVTRDAGLELGEGISQSLIDRVSSSLKRRKNADPVRFVYDAQMPHDLLNYLTRRLSLTKLDSLIAGGRYHNSKDFMDFPDVGASYLRFKPLPQISAPVENTGANIFESIQKEDVLLYYPYHSFSYVTGLLKTAAIDPAVKSIQICLYRLAKNSVVVDALINAVRNHKKVTAIVELQARFDEEANIGWAERLTESGVNIIFGVPGLKVHSKLILITRRENNVLRYYSHVGTGNFNEKTAKIYTDFALLTYNQEIGREIADVFEFIHFTHRRYEFKHLGVSPHANRSNLVNHIKAETKAAKSGSYAAIMIKCNNLVDSEIIERLYKASQAGVQIRIIVRGMCALVPGKKGVSENIRAISVVDRFLEHPRLWVFQNAGDPKYFISSADLMTRNLDYRIEVTAPIYDPKLKKMMQDILDIQWRDNVKARIVDAKQENNFRVVKNRSVQIRSQEAIHRYLSTGKMPRMKKKRLIKPQLVEK